MVVSIDPNSSGSLSICSEEYDKKVVGVISGANGVKPGMMMGQNGTLAYGDHRDALRATAGAIGIKVLEL